VLSLIARNRRTLVRHHDLDAARVPQQTHCNRRDAMMQSVFD
jgi:hypothetical protein